MSLNNFSGPWSTPEKVWTNRYCMNWLLFLGNKPTEAPLCTYRCGRIQTHDFLITRACIPILGWMHMLGRLRMIKSMLQPKQWVAGMSRHLVGNMNDHGRPSLMVFTVSWECIRWMTTSGHLPRKMWRIQRIGRRFSRIHDFIWFSLMSCLILCSV